MLGTALFAPSKLLADLVAFTGKRLSNVRVPPHPRQPFTDGPKLFRKNRLVRGLRYSPDIDPWWHGALPIIDVLDHIQGLLEQTIRQSMKCLSIEFMSETQRILEANPELFHTQFTQWIELLACIQKHTRKFNELETFSGLIQRSLADVTKKIVYGISPKGLSFQIPKIG